MGTEYWCSGCKYTLLGTQHPPLTSQTYLQFTPSHSTEEEGPAPNVSVTGVLLARHVATFASNLPVLYFLICYLAASGLSCGTQDPGCSTQTLVAVSSFSHSVVSDSL